jgi:acetylornithine/N-succinyldiaminopimelate aminotransferase
VIPAEDSYLLALRQLTAERGVLLILDEIQTGMGRTGRLFAYEHTGIRPDILTLGKGMGGGLPLAALLARADVCCFAYGDQGGTFNGNPLMTAGGLAVLETLLEPGFLPKVVATGEHLAAGLAALAARHGLGAVRGRGLLLALDLKRPCGPALVDAALAQGLLLNAPRADSLRFMPALTVTPEEVDRMLAILDRVCAGVLAT